MKHFILVSIVAAFVACSSEGSDTPDAAPAVDAFHTICGNPGDMGNEVGVGKFCAKLSDCGGNMGATLCAKLGDPAAHFCTKTCTMGSTTECGANAMCICQGGSCGCTPNACLGM